MDDPLTVWPIDDTDAGTELVTTQGRCVDFCAADGPFERATVARHGPWCISRPCGHEVTADTDAGPAEITVELAAAYLDGRYDSQDYWRVAGKRYIRLRTDSRSADRQLGLVYLGSGTARQLAATLIRAADHADQLNAPLTGALQQRVARSLLP
jgi:hypothetical protein